MIKRDRALTKFDFAFVWIVAIVRLKTNEQVDC